jgi:arylsulfatase A-like enzyme
MSDEHQGPAYAGFEGRVGRTFAGSQGWWPPRAVPPAGAPNVVVILADDLGYADLGCYGSEIETPNLDRLAGGGLAYSNFHVTPMCSPTRASLLTGVQHHLAGFGTVAHSDAGFPGYAMELPATTATLPEILGAQGYATFMVGKWHLAKDSDISAAGPQHSWPCQRGFDRFYGFLDAFTNLHQPHRLTEDNHQVLVDRYPDDFYLTDDLTDHAVGMIRESKASNPDQPFFLYFAHGAVHAPLHAKAADIARYRGRYDAGWDELRRRRHARQLELGVIAPGTPLAPRNTETDHDVIPWDDLSDQERELFARHMEVYAAMVDGIDQSVGHLLDALEELGERDNTIVVFLSDNGGSREGEVTGTSSYYVHLLQGDDVEADRARIDLLGGPRTTPHYPRGWAMASNTPWRLYKINTHAGGHTVPFILSWPGGGLGGSAGSGWRRQYTHVTDLLPTLCELVGIEPDRRRVDPARPDVAAEPLPLAGSSFVDTVTDPDAPSGHHTTVEEMNGHRGLYRDGWEVVTLHHPLTPFDDEEWELYDLEQDPVELEDRAGAEPTRRAEMIEAWEREAWANQIYPLDEGSAIRYLIRPERSEVFRQPVRIVAGTPSLERWRSVQLIWFRSVTITVELDYAAGDQGILVAHGDQGSGYALYVLDGELRFVHNDGRGRQRRLSGGPVPVGARRLEARLHAVGGGTWTVTLVVAGQDRGRLEGVPLLYGMAPFEGIDVGIDRRSPVDWDLYERFGPFPWSGRLEAVTYTPGEDAPDSPGNLMEVIRAMGQRFE